MRMRLKLTMCLFTIILYTFCYTTTIFAEEIDQNIFPQNLVGEYEILIDKKTGFMIYGKNENERCFPASTTKIMTALLTIEAVESGKYTYDDRITFSKEAVYGIEQGSSNIGMSVGDTLSINEALYGIMLPSANEVAAALAEQVGGSIEGFADMMNKRAKQLGADSTHFVNPHGLHDENHYTTPYDLALIMRECISHDKFVELISKRSYFIPIGENQNREIPMGNTNKLIQKGEFYYENIVGGKTGYTDEARHTLVTYANNEDIGLIAAVMKSDKNVPYRDSAALFDHGFGAYENKKILDKDAYSTTLTIYEDEDKKTVTLVPQNDVMEKLPKLMDLDDFEQGLITSEDKDLNEGEVAGELNLTYGDIQIAKVNLVISNIESEPLPNKNIIENDENDENDKSVKPENLGMHDQETFKQIDAVSKSDKASYSNNTTMLLLAGLLVLVCTAVVIVLLKIYSVGRKFKSYKNGGYYKKI